MTNKGSGVFLYQGERISAKEISRRSGVPFTTIRSRLYRGLSVEAAVSAAPKLQRFQFRGERVTLRELAACTGVTWSCIRNRLYAQKIRGGAIDVEQLVAPKIRRAPASVAAKRRAAAAVKRAAREERDAVFKRAAAESGVPEYLIRQRVNRGHTIEKAVKMPARQHSLSDEAAAKFVRRVFGKLTIEHMYRNKRTWMARCRCTCGKEVTLDLSRLRSGNSKSCGCGKYQSRPLRRFQMKDGRVLTYDDLALIAGVTKARIIERINSGKSPEEAIVNPVPHDPTDVVGQTFGRLTILRAGGELRENVEWKCICGKTGQSNRYNVLKGGTRSCGCLKKGLRTKRIEDRSGEIIGGVKVLRSAPERVNEKHRSLWVCACPKCKSEFTSTLEELKRMRRPKLCDACVSRRTRGSQHRPRWSIELFGAKLTIAELSKLSGVRQPTLRARLSRGMTAFQAAFDPAYVDRFRKFKIGDEQLTAEEIAKRAGISESTFWTRFYGNKYKGKYGGGMAPEEILRAGPARTHRPYRSRQLRKIQRELH